MATIINWMISMEFPKRLADLRKQRSLTQQALADAIGINVSQLKRYEAGTSQPTLEVIRKIAVTLSVSADELLFDKDERNPDQDLMLQFEKVSQMSDGDKTIIKALLDGMIIKFQTEQMLNNRTVK